MNFILKWKLATNLALLQCIKDLNSQMPFSQMDRPWYSPSGMGYPPMMHGYYSSSAMALPPIGMPGYPQPAMGFPPVDIPGYFPPQPLSPSVIPMPPPIIPVPFAVPIPTSKEDTTNMTMKRDVPMAVPVPMVRPVQLAVPAPSPPQFCQNLVNKTIGCPPCPPCLCAPYCTPAFFSFCSPCHLKCRCRRGDDTPMPQPLIPPQPVQGPAFLMPIPPVLPTTTTPCSEPLTPPSSNENKIC